jgi:hypothetical protein
MNILKNRVKLYRGVTEQLRHLKDLFEEYFPPHNNYNNWLRNPFIGSFQVEDFSINECEQLTDIVIHF